MITNILIKSRLNQDYRLWSKLFNEKNPSYFFLLFEQGQAESGEELGGVGREFGVGKERPRRLGQEQKEG